MLDGADDVQQVGVRARQPLPEDDQAARQGVSAFHGDGDRDGHVRVSHEVRRPAADPGSTHCEEKKVTWIDIGKKKRIIL